MVWLAIPQSFIQQLLLQCEIEEIISSYAVLKNEGRNRKCLCPFHSEKTPSFVVYNDTQSFYCFGCGAGGDVITFLMRVENLDYVEAVRLLAKRCGMEVPDDAGDDRSAQLKAKVLEINRAAARFFNTCLKTKEGQPGLAYLKKRGLSDQTITKYGIGFAPDGWDHLKNHLVGKGFTLEELAAACVITKSRKGSYFDSFRNRVMFPIIDIRGSVIAFGGRVLDDSKPKYLNSPDTPVFKKSRNLFSLNFAKNVKGGRMILAEGYMDVIAVNAAGFENVVATLGTALTAEQSRLIAKYAHEVVIAYDSDEAGQAATHRAVNLLSEVGLATKILKLSDAKDPDEYIKKFGVKRFELLLDGAGDVIEFELNKLKASIRLEETDGKIAYIRKAVGILSSINNALEREIYAGIIAKDTGVSQVSVMSQVKSSMKRKYKAREKKEWGEIQSNKSVVTDRINPEKSANLKEALAEERLIAFLFRNPDHLPYILSRISAEDFVTDFNKRVFTSILEIIKAGGELVFSVLVPGFTQEETAKIAQMLAKSSGLQNTKEMLDDYIDVLKAHKNSLSPSEIGAADPEKLDQYLRLLQEKKKPAKHS